MHSVIRTYLLGILNNQSNKRVEMNPKEPKYDYKSIFWKKNMEGKVQVVPKMTFLSTKTFLTEIEL